MVKLDEKTRFPHWAEILSLLLIVAVALFARLYGHDPEAVLSFEEFNLFNGVDFVLSFVYHLDQPGSPVREFWQTHFPDLIPPLEIHSPFMNRPWVPAKEYDAVMSAHASGSTFYPRPLGGNLGIPFEDRTYSGFRKTFHNIGIQEYHPGTPVWFLGGLSAIFLGKGITSFSLDLLPPMVAFRLPSVLLSTLTCLAVFYAARRWFRNNWTALFARLFLALEPLFLTASRDAKVDAGMAFFTFMAVWSYWEARERQKRRWLVLTGLWIGLALATKGQAIILPFILITWDVLRTWLNDDIGRLRILKPLFLVASLLLVSVAAPLLWLGYRVIPADLMARAFESDLGFLVTVVGSYLFVLLICLVLAWPFGQSIGVLKDTLEHICRVRVAHVARVKNRRYVTHLTVDMLVLATVALFSFVLLFPNAWGSPVGVLAEWFAHYGGAAAAGLRATYFVTRTFYLPLYYYPVVVLIKTSPLFLVALVIGLVVGVRWLKRHRLRESSTAQVLLLTFVFCTTYLLLASSAAANKSAKELASVFPFFAMWAGLGMVWLVSYVTRLVKRPSLLAVLSALGVGWIVVAGLLGCITHVPYTGVWYNYLVGPPENGARIEWLGGDIVSGYELAGRYIAQAYGYDKRVLGSGEVGWLNMSYPDVYRVEPLSREASFQDVYDLIQGYDLIVIHRMETQRRPHAVFHRFFAHQTPVHRVVINGVELIQVFDVRQVKPVIE